MAEVQGEVEVCGGSQEGLVSLYVADLEHNVRDADLYEAFNQIGPLNSVRVCRDDNTGRSFGYGYVNYCYAEDAAKAKETLNYTTLNGKTIRVMFSNQDHGTRASSGNVFVKNLDKSIDNKGLHDSFSAYGNIISCKIATDSSGQSKGYGFVQYDSEECAQKAIEQLNGMVINDKQVFVGPFLCKQERELAADRLKFTNVFVKNLSEATTEEDLHNRFGEFGKITSVVVMRESNGKSKCFGFVNFENADAAARSVETLNGMIIDQKEWYVGKAQRKYEREHELRVRYEQNVNVQARRGERREDRREGHQQEQYSNMHPVGVTSVGPRMPMYPPGGQGPQQIFYAQGHPAFFHPQPGFGYPTQLVQAMRPSGAPMPNIFVPMAQQGQQGLRLAGGRGAGIIAGPHAQQGVPLMQPQLQAFPRGVAYRPPHGRGIPVPVHGMVPAPSNAGGMQFREATGSLPIPIGALASLVSSSSPADQRMLLGENLYPLVERLEPALAAKVTGMLLELDQSEVLHLLESPQVLQAKVAEALEVLRIVTQQTGTPVDQLSAVFSQR